MTKRSIAVTLALSLGMSLLTPAVPASAQTDHRTGVTETTTELNTPDNEENVDTEENVGNGEAVDTEETGSTEETVDTEEATEAKQETGTEESGDTVQPEEEAGTEESTDTADNDTDIQAVKKVALNSTNFPDANFRSYLYYTFDSDRDNYIDANEVEELRIYDQEISTLKGIEFFSNLEMLACGRNKIKSVDLSKNTNLKQLYIFDNQLTSLNVSKNTKLWLINCKNNQLTKLDVSSNTQLMTLYCDGNKLTSLNVSKNSKLEHLYCSYNYLTSLDVSNNKLVSFNCSYNYLQNEDFSYVDTTDMSEFTISPQREAVELNEENFPDEIFREYLSDTFDKDKDGKISSVDVTTIDVHLKNITSLKGIELFPDLKELRCGSNEIEELDVSKNLKLEVLMCGANYLESLNLRNNKKLWCVDCCYNYLGKENFSYLDIASFTNDHQKMPRGKVQFTEKNFPD